MDSIKKVTIRELVRNTSTVFKNLPVIVTFRGKAVALISPYDPKERAEMQNMPESTEAGDRNDVPGDVRPAETSGNMGSL